MTSKKWFELVFLLITMLSIWYYDSLNK